MRKDYEGIGTSVVARIEEEPTLSEKLKMIEEHLRGIEGRVQDVHNRLFGSDLLRGEDASKMPIPSIERTTENCIALAYGVSTKLDEILEKL